MKLLIVLAAACAALAAGCGAFDPKSASTALVLDGRTPEKTYVLSKDSKNPKGAPVPFNHETHSTKNYNVEGTGTIACVACHHTDQPASEAAKTPPLKTAHPADRTTTLTADLFAKNPSAPEVLSCRSCHEQEGKKPKVGAENPSVVYEGDSDPTVLNNEEAYHRNCNSCHDAAVEKRPALKIPTSQQCAECHTGKTTP